MDNAPYSTTVHPPMRSLSGDLPSTAAHYQTTSFSPRSVTTPSGVSHPNSFATTPQNGDKLSLSQFLGKYHQDFPIPIKVCKGYCGPSEDLSISEGDRFNVHFVKYTTVVTIEFDNGTHFNVPLNSAVPFGLLYNPHNNLNEAMKGYKFEKVSDLLQMPKLPVLLFVRKAYQGSSPESSIAVNELLLVRKVHTKLMGMGKQQLKVFSLSQNREKTLSPNCWGNFSTKPREVCLYLPEMIKNLPDIFPCKAVLFNNVMEKEVSNSSINNRLPSRAGSVTKLGMASVVTMLHSSIETSIVATSALESVELENARLLDIPIDLNILVRVDDVLDEDETQRLYEDTSFFYQNFNPSKLCTYKQASNPQLLETQSRFYTNVHYGQERQGVDLSRPRGINEEGHYQVPRPVTDGATTTGTPNNGIESLYHPPDTGSRRSNVGSRTETQSSSSESWRPPLPPPRVKKDSTPRRTPGYEYIETNPRCTRAVDSGRTPDSEGAQLSSSCPDSAHSDYSFGSTGSGGAEVASRRNSATGRQQGGSGSDSGVVCQRRQDTSAQYKGHSRSHSGSHITPLTVHSEATPPPSMATVLTRRQTSVPPRPESLIFNGVLDDLNKLTQDLDSCLIKSDSNTDVSSSSAVVVSGSTDKPSSKDEEDMSSSGLYDSLSSFTPNQQPSPQEPQSTPPPATEASAIEKHKRYLASLDNYQVLRLLDAMGLEQYSPTFKQQQINGDILADCDEEILKTELQITSRLHRMRLLRVISGQYSVIDIMSGKDGYVMMLRPNAC